ncbi:MAG: hypothetical protein U9Q70_01330 [Chloroflexota bacterium]|nr:hypothetical protein [Chloroflexota bacterium]
MSWFWFGLGLLSGWGTIALHVWTVARLVPQSKVGILIWTHTGLVLRWLLIAATLTAALQSGIMTGLAAFAGIWLMRRWMLYRIYKQQAFTGWLRGKE